MTTCILWRVATAAAMIAAPLPAWAQQAQTYSCTDSQSGHVSRYQIGPGFYAEFDSAKGEWSRNWCAEDEVTCTWSGSKFQVGGMGWDFDYDSSNGSYSYGDMGGDNDEAGTCRPE